MKPKFKDLQAWEQAQILLQPAFLRVIDNIRKQLEESDWQGTYQEVETPIPGYQLCLNKQGRCLEVNIWELCYSVCFHTYPTLSHTDSCEVEIDLSLFDDTGDVNWELLEAKTIKIIENLFITIDNS